MGLNFAIVVKSGPKKPLLENIHCLCGQWPIWPFCTNFLGKGIFRVQLYWITFHIQAKYTQQKKKFCDSVVNADLFQNQATSFYMLYISF